MINNPLNLRLLLATCSFLLLSGCSGSNPAIEYYQFSHTATINQPEVNRTSATLVLADPVLFGAISNRGIAMKHSEHQMRNAHYHLWDQPLDGMLLNSAEQQLATVLPDVFISKKRAALPFTSHSQHYELQWELTEFNGGITHNAEISGLWRIIKFKNGLADVVLLNQYFNVSIDLEQDGYRGLVQALESAWQQVVHQAATEFTHHKLNKH